MSDDRLDVKLRTRVDSLDRTFIYCKILEGDDLTRDDLLMILRTLADGITGEWQRKLTFEGDDLPARIKGYKLKGQGRKRGSKTVVSDLNIALDYQQLIDGTHFYIDGLFTPSAALELLSKESFKLYGRALGIEAIANSMTKGRKQIPKTVTI